MYTGYFKGHAAVGVNGTNTVSSNPSAPAALHANVRYVHPVFYCNYNGQTGRSEVDEIAIDIVPEDADQIAESATKKWAGETGADITGDHAGDVNYTGPTPPAHKTGRLWRNTNWCGQDCVGHWCMNDTAVSKTIKDESPHGNHGAAQQYASALSTAGKNGKALTFNGTSDRITIADSASMNVGTGDFSFTMWFKSSSATTQRLICKRATTAPTTGYDFYVYSDGRIGGYLADSSGAYNAKTWTPPISVIDGQWHFLGISIDRDGNSYFYVDGVLSSAVSFAAAAGTLDVALPAYLGQYASGSWFSGAMDNVMFFRRALTKDDFDALYDAGTGTEQFGLGSTRALMRSDGTYWLLATSDSPTIPRTAEEIAESEAKKWAGESGADVTRNSNIAVGVFWETFENTRDDLASRFTLYGGAGELSIVAGQGVAGGKVLQVGNNSGDDFAQVISCTSIPYDPGKLYRMRFRVRRTAGTGTFSIGLCGRNHDDTAYVSYTGTNSAAGRHWIGASAVEPATWTVYTCYFRGVAATGSYTEHAHPDDPAVLHQDVRYVRPMFKANASGSPGIFQVDEISIDIMPDGGAVGTDAIAPGSVVSYGAAYTDEFATIAPASGETDVQTITITATGLPVVVQYGVTVQYLSAAASVTLRLYRVGTTDALQTSTTIKAESGDDKGYFSSFIHTPAAGSQTYKVTAVAITNSLFVGKRFLSVTEFKR